MRSDGDAALLDLTAKLDRVELASLEVGQAEFAAAGDCFSEAQRAAIRAAAANIEAFHEPQLPPPLAVDTPPGVRCERVSRAIESVGLYVPAGNAPLPSTALMLGVPARLAGCPTRILCTPPQADGRADPAVLYAARVSGVQRVFKLGGAQAIAALAYGTETVPKVDKVFGPGSVWVTEAKAQVDRDPYGAARDLSGRPIRGARDCGRDRRSRVRRGRPLVAGRARRRLAGAAVDDAARSSRRPSPRRSRARRRRCRGAESSTARSATRARSSSPISPRRSRSRTPMRRST